MKLWLRVRRSATCAATALGVAAALFLISNLYLPLPNLFGGAGLRVPVALLLPLAVAIVVAWGLTTGEPLLEAVASRPLLAMDALYAVSAAAFTLLVCALVQEMGRNGLALAAGRNALGYVGLALIGRWLLGSQAGALLPTGLTFIVSWVGYGAGRHPHWWAWQLHTTADLISWVVALWLLTTGAAVSLVRARYVDGES